MKQLTPVLALALLLPSTAAAQESGLGLTLEMRADGTYYGNFFQATDGAPTVDVFAGTGQVQLELSGRSGGVFVRASGTVYDRFDPGAAVLGGGRLNFGAHYLEAFGGIRLRNPRVEVGSEIGSADVAVATGSYSIRPIPAVEISALVDYYTSSYSQTTERNHQFLGGGGALELRSFRYTFIPEIGAQVGRLDVRDDIEDYDEQTLWAAVTSIPVPAVYLNVRYRYRLRQYTTDSPISSNFGREDARHQITLTGDVELGGPWSLVAYYSFQNASSSLPSRVFTTHLLITGLAYRIGGGQTTASASADPEPAPEVGAEPEPRTEATPDPVPESETEPEPAPPAAGTLFTVGVGALVAPSTARRWSDRLRAMGLPVWRLERVIGGEPAIRLRAGATESRAEARALAAVLEDAGWAVAVDSVAAGEPVPPGAVAATREFLDRQ